MGSCLLCLSIPSMENTGSNLTEQEDRFNEMLSTRAEAAKIIAEEQIRTALKTNVPPAEKYKLHTGQTVIAYSEQQNKWVKNLKVVPVSSKQVWINNGSRLFNLSISHVILQPSNDEANAVSSLFKQLSPL